MPLRHKVLFKRHTLVQKRSEPDFYEVMTNETDNRDWVDVAPVNATTGEVDEYKITYGYVDLLNRVSTQHPVYRIWSQRRIADRLEGKDR